VAGQQQITNIWEALQRVTKKHPTLEKKHQEQRIGVVVGGFPVYSAIRKFDVQTGYCVTM
jgi:hypothetical protein